ncbi:MAG TPA: RecQ family ATP-dependent DNA helicase [Tepidisphaeraceae bacterium]|nr:RecQ family ATP-dependent DNA helicase [Tepidisphaeraceae bacterium]
MTDLRARLQELFGLEDFRPAQREVIEEVLGGRDVLCVMPTGAGKSLCYQLPAAAGGGLSIVVSPLISLMQDQVQQLRDEGLSAAFINSTQNSTQQRDVMSDLERGWEGLLYVAPERFWQPNFVGRLAKLGPRLLAIDEAHCISTWGHDFRPEYARLGEVRKMLGEPTTIALTATATEDVRSEIVEKLGLRRPKIFITGFDRPNLRYESKSIAKVRDKDAELIHLVKKEQGSGIVYCATRKGVDEVTEMLKRECPERMIVPYHAGMELEARTKNQEAFMEGRAAVAVATNAFGMGINKPDIRFVIHCNIPGTVEAYYQEAGRAGRDGSPSRCVLLFSYQDRYIHEFFISKIGEENSDAPQVEQPDLEHIQALKDHAMQKLEMVIQYAQTHRCRREMILDYFGDESEVRDCNCDVCHRDDGGMTATGIVLSDEVQVLVKKLLSGIARVSPQGQFGVGLVAEVLAGAENERISRWHLDHLSVYGLLRVYPIKRVIAMLHRLMEAGLAKQRDADGTKFRPVVELTTSGVEVMKGTQPAPATLADLAGGQSQETRRVVVTVAEDRPLDEEARERFEKLRALRLALARQKQLPPYCICHDSTLKQIAQTAPRNLHSLEMVKGMGPKKVEMYGKAILETIAGNEQ